MLFVRDRSFYRALLLIALPVALQNLVSFSVNMLDSVMVGSLGEVTLGAVSIGNQISLFLMMIVKGISAGTSVMISQYWGQKNLTRIRQIFSIGFLSSFGIAAVFFSAAFFFPAQVVSIFTDKPALIEEGARYVRVIAFTYIFYAVTENMIVMLRCVEIVRFTLIVSTVSLFVNLAGDYVMIFGKLGFPAMGITGAALSTVIGRGLELAVIAVYVLRYEKRLSLRPRHLLEGSREMWIDFARYGIPLMSADVLWGLVGVGKQMIMGRLGEAAVAANSIAEVVLQLAMMFVNGLAAASATLIGKSIGAGEYDKTRAYAKTVQVIFFSLGILASLLTFSLRHVVPRFYNISDATRQMASQFLVFGALTIWATAYAASCFQGINRGSGDVKFVLTVNMLCGWLLVLPLSFLGAFVFHAAPPLVFFFTRSDQIVKVFIAFFRLHTNRWIRNVTRST